MMRVGNTQMIVAIWVAVTGVAGTVVALGEAAINVQSWTLRTQAGDFVNGPGEAEVVDNTFALPFTLTREVESGASRSTSSYAFDVAPAGAIFHFDFDHVRDGDGPSEGRLVGDYASSSGRVTFSASEPMDYIIDGLYAMTGSGSIQLQVSLTKLPMRATAFWSLQYSTCESRTVAFWRSCRKVHSFGSGHIEAFAGEFHED